MSDSEDGISVPSAQAIEDALRSVVLEATKRDEEVTVKSARTAAEEKLGLHSGYLKDDVEWKQRSADIIRAAFDEPASPEEPKKNPANAGGGTKRKSDVSDGNEVKRRKKSAAPDSREEQHNSNSEAEVESDAPKPKTKPTLRVEPKVEAKSGNTSALSSPPDTDALDEHAASSKANGKAAANSGTIDDDESDLSSVIDDPPPKKKRQKKSSSPSTTKSKPAKTVKPAKPSKPDKVLTPDEEEIKRLQSWLLKCGIRKLWHRELEPYSTPKEKIRHLKGMLEDVGMTGRYSAEKARQIKEQRELKAELEAAKEFNDQWGHEQEDDDDGDGEEKKSEEGGGQRRGRLKPRGLIDFGDDDDDSE